MDIEREYLVEQQLLSDVFEQQLSNSNLLSEASPKIIAVALRIRHDLQNLESMAIEADKLEELRDLQLACIEHHIKSLIDYQYYNYSRSKAPYAEIIKFLKSFRSEKGELRVLGRKGMMLSAHPLSETLETMRLQLLTECYARLLLIEDQQEKDSQDLHSSVETKKIDQTGKLALQLLLGLPEGKFPLVEETYVEEEAKKFFEGIWYYLSNTFSIYPLGWYPGGHYDRNFYVFLLSLTQENGSEIKLAPLWEAFVKFPTNIPCPQARFTALFKWLNSVINKVTLASQQRIFKESLQQFARIYGIDESSVKELAFNSAQRRVNFAHRTGTLRQFSLCENFENAGQVKVLKAMHDLATTEDKFAENIKEFVCGDASTRGSLVSLMTKLIGYNLGEVRQKQLRTVEKLYAELLKNLGEFSEMLSGCVSSENSVVEKLNCLYATVVGNDRKNFTQYMLHLTVTALFLGKFVGDIKTMLSDLKSGAEVAPFEDNMARSYQHLFKISEAFEKISCMVRKEDWPVQAGDQVLQAALMHKRANYFSGVADILRDFVTDNHFIDCEDGDPVNRRLVVERHLQARLEKFVEYIGSADLVGMFRDCCQRWLHQWEHEGVLPLDEVMATIGKSISSKPNIVDTGVLSPVSGML